MSNRPPGDPQPAPPEASPAFGSTVTILFSDIRGFTEYTDLYGDEAAYRMLQLHNSVLLEQLALLRGHVVKTQGDSFMVSFESARTAITCAIAIQREMDKLHRQQQGPTIQVGIGINLGEPVRDGADFFGGTVNLAARICGVAEPGEILVSETVRTVAGKMEGATFVDSGLYDIKGFREPQQLFRVDWSEGSQRTAPTAVEPAPSVEKKGGQVGFYSRPPPPPLSNRLFINRIPRLWWAAAGATLLVLLIGGAGVEIALATQAGRQHATGATNPRSVPPSPLSSASTSSSQGTLPTPAGDPLKNIGYTPQGPAQVVLKTVSAGGQLLDAIVVSGPSTEPAYVDFRLDGRYRQLHIIEAVPDNEVGCAFGSAEQVRFEILGDGNLLTDSTNVLTAGQSQELTPLNVGGVSTLRLLVSEASQTGCYPGRNVEAAFANARLT